MGPKSLKRKEEEIAAQAKTIETGEAIYPENDRLQDSFTKDESDITAHLSDSRAEQSQQLPLIKDTDYYLENGFCVFTASFLLRRGYCCDNGCRHCPYPKESKE